MQFLGWDKVRGPATIYHSIPGMLFLINTHAEKKTKQLLCRWLSGTTHCTVNIKKNMLSYFGNGPDCFLEGTLNVAVRACTISVSISRSISLRLHTRVCTQMTLHSDMQTVQNWVRGTVDPCVGKLSLSWRIVFSTLPSSGLEKSAKQIIIIWIIIIIIQYCLCDIVPCTCSLITGIKVLQCLGLTQSQFSAFSVTAKQNQHYTRFSLHPVLQQSDVKKKPENRLLLIHVLISVTVSRSIWCINIY